MNINDKKWLSHLDEATNFQLKAYYVGHADSNLADFLSAFGANAMIDVLPAMPEWVAPFCALVAAAISLGKFVSAIVKSLFGKKPE